MKNAASQSFADSLLRKITHSLFPNPDEIIQMQGEGESTGILPPIAAATFPEEVARQADDNASKRFKQMFTL